MVIDAFLGKRPHYKLETTKLLKVRERWVPENLNKNILFQSRQKRKSDFEPVAPGQSGRQGRAEAHRAGVRWHDARVRLYQDAQQTRTHRRPEHPQRETTGFLFLVNQTYLNISQIVPQVHILVSDF